jgi:hypothetical protein
MAKEAFMVISSGMKAGKPYATLARVIAGTKANGDSYAFLDDNHVIREAEVLEIGTIFHYDMVRAKS